jgi:hypothetical protein
MIAGQNDSAWLLANLGSLSCNKKRAAMALITDDIARRAALRLGGEIDPNLPQPRNAAFHVASEKLPRRKPRKLPTPKRAVQPFGLINR